MKINNFFRNTNLCLVPDFRSNIIHNNCLQYVCKVICPKAGLSFDMHYQGSAYFSLLEKREE